MPRGSSGLYFAILAGLGGSRTAGFEMEFWLEEAGPHRHRLDAGGHRKIPLHLISPPPNSGILPAPPDRPFPAPTQEERGRASKASIPG